MSPHGHFIASSSRNDIVKFWSCETGRQLAQTITGHSDMIVDIAVSRDERTVYTSSRDGTVRSWSIETGARGIVILHVGAPYSRVGLWMHVLADDNLIVSYDSYCVRKGSVGNVMKVAIPSVREDKEDTGLKQTWHTVGCPQTLEFESEEGQMIEHETTLECAFEVTILEEQKYVFAMSEDGTKLVTKQENGNVIIWNGTSLVMTGLIELGEQYGVNGAICNGSGIAILNGNIVTVYDGSETDRDEICRKVGWCNIQLSGYDGELHFLGNGCKIVAHTTAGLIRVLNAGKLEFENERQMENMSGVTAMLQMPDEKYFITVHIDMKIRFWDARTGEESGTCLTTPNGFFVDSKIKMSENGEWIVSVACDAVCVWNLQSRKLKNYFQIENTSIWEGFDVSSDGTCVVLQNMSHLLFWDISKTKQPPAASQPSLLIRRRSTEDKYSLEKPWPWNDLWFRNGTKYIVSVSNEWIEEWVMSSGKYIKSQELPTPSYRISREEIVKVLNNSKRQVINTVEETSRFLSYNNGIQLESNKVRKTLATLESERHELLYCSTSNILCVGFRNGLLFFRFYPDI